MMRKTIIASSGEIIKDVSRGKVYTVYKYLTVKLDISFVQFRMNCL